LHNQLYTPNEKIHYLPVFITFTICCKKDKNDNPPPVVIPPVVVPSPDIELKLRPKTIQVKLPPMLRLTADGTNLKGYTPRTTEGHQLCAHF
jgi:hypothetical protein